MKEDNANLKSEYELLRSKMSEDGENLTLLEKFAEVCYKLKKEKEAIEIYEKLIKEQPETSKYNYRLGKLLFRLEKYREALEQQNIAIEKWNNFQWAKYEKTKCLIKLNRLDDAMESFTEFNLIIDSQGKDQILQKAIIRLKFDLMVDINKYDMAIELGEKLFHLEPDDGNIPYKCGKIFLEQKQFEKALEKFNMASVLLKKNYVKDKIAITLSYLEKLSDAVEVYKSIPFHQMDDYIFQHYGRLLYKMGSYEDAKQQLKYAILKKGKSEFKSHYYLGLVYERLEKYKNTLKEFETAQRLRKEKYNVDYFEALQKIIVINKNKIIDENELLEEYTDFQKGVIIKYKEDKGYGFIRDADNQQFFFHIKNCCYKNPKYGDRVKYFLIDGKKGKKEANNVILIK